jgi:hypothetical protein
MREKYIDKGGTLFLETNT